MLLLAVRPVPSKRSKKMKRIRMTSAQRIGDPSSVGRCYRNLASRLVLLGLLLVASPPTTHRGFVAFVHADCPPNKDCGPYGTCILDTRSCGNNCQESCKCDPGYFGPDCSYQAEICPNSILGAKNGAQECYNGGTCYPVTQLTSSNADGSAADAAESVDYMCDCRKAYGDAGKVIYAGNQCQYPAQTSCENNVASSTYAFCVNGGTCQSVVPSGSPAPNCTCPQGFVGRHCQYEYETAPPKELEYSPPGSANRGNPMSPAAIFFLVLFATSFVVGVALFAWRRQRQRNLADKVEVGMGSSNGHDGMMERPTSPSSATNKGGGSQQHDLYLQDEDLDAEDGKEVSSSPEWTRSAGGDRDALRPPERREII